MSDAAEEEQKALKVLNDARVRGWKDAWHDVFMMAARELDFGGTTEDQLRSKLAHLQQERGYAIAALRELCQHFKLSNSWSDNLFLADVVEKHVGRSLRGRVLSEDVPPGHYSSEHPGILEVID